MQDILRFNRMITPVIIEILYWLLTGATILWGIILIVKGASDDFGGGSTVLFGLAIVLGGPVLIRVYCELLLVIFKIHEGVEAIRKSKE